MNTNFKQSSAYELADWIDEVNKPIVGSKTMKQASDMLRQQADRIAELEKQLQESAMNCISAYAQADDHYARVKELEAKNAELKATVRSFFEDFLDIREESDSGRLFAPITISSCRCMMIEPLAEVLAKLRTLSGAEKEEK